MPETPLPQRLVRAATRPAQLRLLAGGAAAAGAAAGLGVALDSPLPALAVAALTALGWAATTAWDALYDRSLAEPAPSEALPIEDPALRTRLAAVREAAAAVRAAVEAVEGPMEGHLAEALGSCRELEEGAVRLAERGDVLLRVAAEAADDTLRGKAEDYEARARAARDREARERWKEAAARTRAQIGHARELYAAVERIHAELAAVEGALGELRARVLKVGASGLDEGEVPGAEVRATLRTMDDELTSLEKAARATLREVSG